MTLQTPSIQHHPKFNHLASMDNKEKNAAENFAQFYCYTIAKTFTDTFETENFDQQMTSTFLPEALGVVLAESHIGESLQEGVQDVIEKLSKGRPTQTNRVYPPSNKPVERAQHHDYTPPEMLEAEKWTR